MVFDACADGPEFVAKPCANGPPQNRDKAPIDPTHFAVVMVLNLMTGLPTPPFGIVLFVLQQVSGLKFDRIVKAIAPFYIPLGTVLVMITFIAGPVTWLPKLLMGISK